MVASPRPGRGGGALRDFHLAFHEEAWPDHEVIDLLDVAPDVLPTEPGVYVLGTAGETMLVYP